MSYSHLVTKLQPGFSLDDMEALQAFHSFYLKYQTQVTQDLRHTLSHHPIFGPILKNQDLDTQLKEERLSSELQESAIMKGEWEPYTRHLMRQGTAYGQMGLEFHDWYSVVKLFREKLQPYLVEEYHGNVDHLLRVWNGADKLLDYTMSSIAAAYMGAKNNRILEEKTRAQTALEELQSIQERFRLAIEGSSAGIWDWDIRTNEVFYAPRFKALLGYEEHEFADQFDSFANALHPRDKKYVFEKINATLENDVPYDVIYRLKTKKRGYRWFLTRGKVLRDELGIAYRMAGSISDITNAKKAEEEVKKLNATLEQKVKERTTDLQETNKELESFSYTVSHDLRAPLRAIDGFSKVLVSSLGGKIEPDALHYLEVIIENVGKMGHLIDDLLAFSRMSRREKREVTFDTCQLVNEVFNDLMQIEDGKKTTLKLDKHLPPMFADREMMKHVFANLLGNAIKFSGSRQKPLVEVGYQTSQYELVYFVRDNGVGFDMKYAKKLFGIFQRLHSEDEFEGTGVGLAIVQRIIHRHGGKIWVDSEEEKGATFYFSLSTNEKQNDKG
ncbi:ATP-binding protein [Imperialibacter roseus]|uniref:histidine kinase n=1 Tax=Imperialibacter roseus TaxID=1324217 RepID=A0ABZ0IWD6_9BACT|nr:ATP-binding protein [Imperialibacter roseus]WOK09375.1 PAS domain-containing protein [Imperialibacter roseus]|tara:strand:- start:10921 stop:12591 length:1671 start_codon:yes stop_codon:yes gene_type:complete